MTHDTKYQQRPNGSLDAEQSKEFLSKTSSVRQLHWHCDSSITCLHRANNHSLFHNLSMAGGKLHDIKETASDAVEILRELGTPGVQETLERIREVAIIGRDIMQILKEPEWQQNIENMKLISQNFNQASERMERTMKAVKDTGVIDETKELIVLAKEKMRSLDTDGNGEHQTIILQDIREISASIREMFESMKGLSDELRVTIRESRLPAGTIRNIQETSQEIQEAYHEIRER